MITALVKGNMMLNITSANSSLQISIVICTRNRADILADLLYTLCQQDLPKTYFEVIVVDNDSNDQTRTIAENYCKQYSYIRYCLEAQHGLSYARNRGWVEAKGEYVGYVDDDCKVPYHWLTLAKKIIDQVAPAAFGGPYYPFYNSPKPYWWKDNYGKFEYSLPSRPLHRCEYLTGGNMFFRRSVLKEMCGFNNRLGMYDQNLGYGEESELQDRIRLSMTEELIYYDHELFVYHLVRPEKMAWRYIVCSRFIGGCYSSYVFRNDNPKSAKPSKLKLLAEAVQILLCLSMDSVAGILYRNRQQYPCLQNYLYENTLKYVRNLGVIYGKLWTNSINKS